MKNQYYSNALDLFTGADGGIAFVKLKANIEAWEGSGSPPPAAVEILSMMERLDRFYGALLDGRL